MDCALVIFTGGRLLEMRVLEIASGKLLVMDSVLGKRWLFSTLKTMMFSCLYFHICQYRLYYTYNKTVSSETI